MRRTVWLMTACGTNATSWSIHCSDRFLGESRHRLLSSHKIVDTGVTSIWEPIYFPLPRGSALRGLRGESPARPR